MHDIEILCNQDGVPTVSLRGHAKEAADKKGIKKVLVSLSHSDVRICAFLYSKLRTDIAITGYSHRICSSIVKARVTCSTP